MHQNQFVGLTIKKKLIHLKYLIVKTPSNFSFFGLSISSIDLISQEVFCDCQINLGNTDNLTSSLYGGIFNISRKEGEPYMRRLDNPLETKLYYLTLLSLLMAIVTFPIT